MKKVKGIVISILIALFGISTMPFSVVHADTLSSSNIEGVNVQLVDVTEISVDNTNLPNNLKRYNWTFKYEVVFDKEYFGYMTGKFTSSFYANDINGQSQQYDIDTGNKSYYICGQSFTYYTQIQVWYSSATSGAFQNLYSASFTLAGSNVVEFGLLNTIEDIQNFISSIDTDITQYFYDSTNGSVIEVLVDQYDMLSDIKYINQSIAENVETISRLRYYNVPIYSWGIVIPSFEKLQLYEPEGEEGRYINSLGYPCFIIPPGTNMNLASLNLSTTSGDSAILIYGISHGLYGISPNANQNGVNITGANGTQVSNIYKYNFTTFGTFNMWKVTFRRGGSSQQLVLKNSGTTNIYFVPILWVDPNETNFRYPLDFALMYNLPNPIIDNLDLLANGNQDLETKILYDLNPTIDDFNDSANDVIDVESDIGSGFEDSLNDIPTSFNFSNQFGASFISSAQWVRDQFNNMTVNNPFGSLITFSLILGVGLLLLGRKLL